MKKYWVCLMLLFSGLAQAQSMDRNAYMSLRIEVLEQLRTSQVRAEKMSKSPNAECRALGSDWERVLFIVTEGLSELTQMEAAGYQFPSIYTGFRFDMSRGWGAFASRLGCPV